MYSLTCNPEYVYYLSCIITTLSSVLDFVPAPLCTPGDHALVLKKICYLYTGTQDAQTRVSDALHTSVYVLLWVDRNSPGHIHTFKADAQSWNAFIAAKCFQA